MDRIILHSDLNNFYASVECFESQKYKNIPVAVTGEPEKRHGIILAKNNLAKAYGIKTGDPLWIAKKKCGDILFIRSDFDKYSKFSNLAKKIYSEYTNKVESFGPDECWLDISNYCNNNIKYGEIIAHKIRMRIKEELGITVSIGVSFNKIFAKLGSDYKKPDAVTVISKDNYKKIVWPMAVENLLFVGRATLKKLYDRGCITIGDLAHLDKGNLEKLLGKNGETLWRFANGKEDSPVLNINEHHPIKSIGNSVTSFRDLMSEDDIKIIFITLCESVAQRLRKAHAKCKVVQISMRDSKLFSFERQCQIAPTDVSFDIFKAAFSLYKLNNKDVFLRSIGVRGMDLVFEKDSQKNIINNNYEKMKYLENSVDDIRNRFGHFSIGKAIMLKDRELSCFNPINEHTIHPEPYR